MNQFGKIVVMAVLSLSLTLLAVGVQAQQEVEVKIGAASPSVASHTHDNNITVNSVNRRKTEYTLRGKSKDRHKVNLTSVQKGDLRDGTTVMIRSTKDAGDGDFKAHQHQVTITLKGEETESSGW